MAEQGRLRLACTAVKADQCLSSLHLQLVSREKSRQLKMNNDHFEVMSKLICVHTVEMYSVQDMAMYRIVFNMETGPEIIKLFSSSTQLSMKIFLLINVKVPQLLAFNIYEREK